MFNSLQTGKTGWCILLIAVIGDFAVPYILANFYKGYNHNLMVMSSLGNPSSPVRVYYNIWLVILGVLLIVSTVTISSKYWFVSKSLTIIMVILILAFAIGAGILSGIFSVNESKAIQTTASKIHGIGSALGFMALLFVPLIQALLSFKMGSKTVGIIFIAAFILAIIFFTFFVMSDKPDFQKTFIRYEGLWQRLCLLFMYLPLAYVAVESLITLHQKH